MSGVPRCHPKVIRGEMAESRFDAVGKVLAELNRSTRTRNREPLRRCGFNTAVLISPGLKGRSPTEGSLGAQMVLARTEGPYKDVQLGRKRLLGETFKVCSDDTLKMDGLADS